MHLKRLELNTVKAKLKVLNEINKEIPCTFHFKFKIIVFI